MAVVTKEFAITGTRTYRVRVKFDDAVYDGAELALEVVHHDEIVALHPGVNDRGTGEFEVVDEHEAEPGSSYFSVEDILPIAGKEREAYLVDLDSETEEVLADA
ncbi:MAG: hypothetical protein KJ077_11020 [Anaerolineae bacterium]|nr:hypothetical protein [Anaerolineae bacterium]